MEIYAWMDVNISELDSYRAGVYQHLKGVEKGRFIPQGYGSLYWMNYGKTS
jgi:hypothetical protein